MLHEADTPLTPRSRVLTARDALLAAFQIIVQYPVLIAMGLVTLFSQMTYSGINNVALPRYIASLHLADEGKIIGALTSTFLLAETFLRVPFGWLSDRFGRARMVIGALLLTAPSLCLGALVPHYSYLFPLRAWDGMMAAALWPSLFAIIGDAVPSRCRANAMGVINMMYMLALMGGFGLSSYAGDLGGAGTRLYLLIGAGLIAVGGVVAWLFFHLRPQFYAPHPEVHLDDAETAVVSVARHVLLLVITFVQNFAITLLAPYLILYITGTTAQDLGFRMRDLLYLVGIPIIGVGLFALPLSRLSDRIGKLTAVRLAFTVIAIALWSFAVNRTLIGLSLSALVIGVAFSMGVPAWLAILSGLSGRKTRGVTLAGYGTAQGMAAVAGPIVAGFFWDGIGHASIFMASAASVSLAAILTWTLLRERKVAPVGE